MEVDKPEDIKNDTVIYRYVYVKDPNIRIDSIPDFSQNIDGNIITIHKAVYKIDCTPAKSNYVHDYLANDAYTGKSNIIGFLNYNFSKSKSDEIKEFGHMWGLRYTYDDTENRNRGIFFTYMDIAERDLDIVKIGCEDFLYVYCDIREGRGIPLTISFDKKGEPIDQYSKNARCTNIRYPNICSANPSDIEKMPVVVKLGMLMTPKANPDEINLVGTTDAKYVKGYYIYLINNYIPHFKHNKTIISHKKKLYSITKYSRLKNKVIADYDFSAHNNHNIRLHYDNYLLLSSQFLFNIKNDITLKRKELLCAENYDMLITKFRTNDYDLPHIDEYDPNDDNRMPSQHDIQEMEKFNKKVEEDIEEETRDYHKNAESRLYITRTDLIRKPNPEIRKPNPVIRKPEDDMEELTKRIKK